MGLTLHYTLRLPGTHAPEDVDRVLSMLHAHAQASSFDVVTDPTILSAASFDPEAESVNEFLRLMVSVMEELSETETPPRLALADTARGFMVAPGDGCEAATFGFLRRTDEDGANPEWHWRCSCKTQYASVTSDEHFVKCHKSIVAFLDHAISLGVEVEVFDEGEYWETRDEQVLIAEVKKMNRIVAALAGRLSDAIGDEHDVQAEIFRHPEFEHLEVERPDDR